MSPYSWTLMLLFFSASLLVYSTTLFFFLSPQKLPNNSLIYKTNKIMLNW